MTTAQKLTIYPECSRPFKHGNRPKVVHVPVAPFVTMTFLLILWEADLNTWGYSDGRYSLV